MAIRCLRHLLLLALWRLGVAQDTKASLGIGVGSRLDSVFDSADADQDGVLSQGEMTVFNQQGEALVGNFALVKPFEVTLFSEADCMGQNRTVDGSSNETRCSKCFDACGHDFEGGGAMAVMSSSSTTGVESKVRSLRVSSGAPQVVVDLCRGSYNYGVAGMEATSVRSSSAGCINFPGSGPAHVAALPQEVAELVAMVFLKADTAPFDDRLTASEATVAGLAPLVQAADADKDGSLSAEEYATLLVHDVVRRSRKDASFMSAAAMEAAAETLAIAELAASGQDPAAATEQADAQLFFGAEYSEAKEDPAQGIPTTTPEPQRDANGSIILAGGPSGEDFGDVKDPSPVDGVYDPQTGEVMMCVNGKEFHAGLCYDYCNFDYTLATLSICWKEECPSGWFEIAGGFCKRSGWNLDTKLMESYDRGLGELPSTCTLGGSFGPGRIVDDGIRDFTVLFVSDTQLPWCGDKPRGNMGCAMEENFRIVQGIHEVRGLKWVVGDDFNASDEQVQEPLGVHITGDLTAFAHPYQFHAYRKIWETRPGEDPDKNLKLPMWPGLGNHDYANNLGDCLYIEEEPVWSGYWRASCAQRMIAYIRSAVAGCDGHTVVNNFGGHVDHYDRENAGYSVRHGRIRFVHLHNYPTYRRELLVGVASTMQFLVDEVAEAERTQDYLVLLIHDIDGNFASFTHSPQLERYHYFAETVAGSRTIAVFAGHFHPWGGWKGNLRDSRTQTNLLNEWGEVIPVVRGWAPDYSAFVVTQWNVAKCFWRFGSVEVPKKDEKKGPPSWKSSSSHEQQHIFRLPNCTIDEDYVGTTTFRSYGSVSGCLQTSAAWSLVLLALALVS